MIRIDGLYGQSRRLRMFLLPCFAVFVAVDIWLFKFNLDATVCKFFLHPLLLSPYRISAYRASHDRSICSYNCGYPDVYLSIVSARRMGVLDTDSHIWGYTLCIGYYPRVSVFPTRTITLGSWTYACAYHLSWFAHDLHLVRTILNINLVL